MDKLKPCPFCGSIAHVAELKKAVKPSPRFFVHCSNTKGHCIASMSDTFGRHYYSEDEAIRAWNRRPEHGDLISREAAIDKLNAIPSGNWSKDRYIRELLNVPSVPAVPLDKLCEWLARNAFAFECEDCEEYCRALLDCEHEAGSDPEYWKNKLTKWMEEQDATD